jgi:hypothetical protein
MPKELMATVQVVPMTGPTRAIAVVLTAANGRTATVARFYGSDAHEQADALALRLKLALKV